MVKTASSPPAQWIVYQMCKMYGCTPNQLMTEDAETVHQHYQIEKTLDRYAGD